MTKFYIFNDINDQFEAEKQKRLIR